MNIRALSHHRATPVLLGAMLTLLSPTESVAQAVPPAPPVDDSAKKADPVQLSTFVVSEDEAVGYESMHTTAGMRTVQELKNVANSISIMNSLFIEDLG